MGNGINRLLSMIPGCDVPLSKSVSQLHDTAASQRVGMLPAQVVTLSMPVLKEQR